MTEEAFGKKAFMAYEYKQISISREQVAMYLDCYENFGWIVDEERSDLKSPGHLMIQMKRNRKIVNKMELTRLQRNFEGCIKEIQMLEQAKTNTALVAALTVGLIGTAFMAGSVFAVTARPPIIWLCILLAVPAFAGWILPYFLYMRIAKKKAEELQPLIEEKYEEIYALCEKGHSLL